MENIDELKDYLHNNFTEALLNEDYSINGTVVQLFSDDENIIKTSNERLKPHFSSNFSTVRNNKIIKLYSLQSKKVEQLIISVNLKNEKYCWKQIEHMGGYYFNVNIVDKFSIIAWVTKNHNSFGDKVFPIRELVTEYINGDEHTCILIDDLENSFFYLYNNIDAYTLLTPIRLIRSLMMRPFLENDFIYFHAAAIRYKNKGFLLSGNSGNGKTSTLLHFLNSKKGELIANDKVFIGIGEERDVRFWGWPTTVALGVGNLNQYDQLEKYLTNIDDVTCVQDLFGYTPKNEYLEISKEQMKKLKSEGNKLVISHKHLADLFNKEIVAGGKIDAIININLEWNCKEKSLRKLNFDEKASMLNNNIIGNKSDQLCWIGYPLLSNNSKYSNSIFKEIFTLVNFYEYRSDFQDHNLTSFLDEVI